MSLHVTVYGAEKKCASCVNAPSALETVEWLENLLPRKYPDFSMDFLYVDIENPQAGYEAFSQQIIDDDRLYPLVTINGEIAVEGTPQIKKIYNAIEEAVSKH